MLRLQVDSCYNNKLQIMKARLEAVKEGDTNAYSHLVEVLKQMVLSNDQNGYHLFEHYSHTVRQQLPSLAPFPQEEYSQLQDYNRKARGLLNKPNVGSEEEPQEPGPCGYLPNLMEEAKLFEKAGVGFGEETTYVIFKALERFSVTKQTKEIKFWGSILGKDKDYYIVETAAEGGEEGEGELAPEAEPKGTGVNRMTYWVSTDLLNGEWKELPVVTPDQLNASRRIKYLFSGHLDKPVCINPHFQGREGHLLKCQIVRISFSCQLVPRTMFTINAEDSKEIEPASEDWKLPGFSFLSSLDNWVHHSQNILNNGRLVLLKPNIPEGVEVDEDKLMKELEEKDPLQARLKPISADRTAAGSGWALKVVGDTNEYRAMSKNKEETVNYGCVCLKSLVWPGWRVVYQNKQWSSIYIGQGSKAVSEWYYPKEPEKVLSECEDRDQQPEPNFPVDDGKAKEAPEE